MAPRFVSSLATAVARPLELRSFLALAIASAALVVAGCGGGSADESVAALVGSGIARAQLVGSVTPTSVTTVSVDALVLKSERRITRTVFEYVYQITVRNQGPALSNVAVQLTGVGPGTTIVDGAVQVGDLAAAATVTPADTITLRQDRTIPFSQAALVWQVTGAATVPGVLLEGPADALATSALREVDLMTGVPPEERVRDSDGAMVALTMLTLRFSATATVGEVNGLLTRHGARIVGMSKNSRSLILSIPNPGSTAALDILIAALESQPTVDQVFRAYFTKPDSLPQGYAPSTLSPFQIIDHLVGINAPAAWNARAALLGRRLPGFLLADWFGDGMPESPPFAISAQPNDFLTGTYKTGHGYHVLGIAAADFGGSLPTGLLPTFTGFPLTVRAVDASAGMPTPMIHQRLISRIHALTEDGYGNVDRSAHVVINTSLGLACMDLLEIDYIPCRAGVAESQAIDWVTRIRDEQLEERFVHATAAGNIEGADNDDARVASAFTAAALAVLRDAKGNLIRNLTNTIVVENVVGRSGPPYEPQCLDKSSKVGGELSAIGADVWSHLRPSAIEFGDKTGTSMATPQVAALATYVWALNPSLTPEQVKERLIGTARAVTSPSALPANCKATTPAPRINAYGAVLAADNPKAIDGTGTPADAPARLAVLDVANTSGVEGGDGKFDQGDLQVFLSKIPQGVGPAQSHRSGYDWSRYDLSGDGHTGPDRGNQFNLDMTLPISLTTVTAPEDASLSCNEGCVSDMQILCYYAYSPLFDATANRVARDGLLKRYCNRGPKSWTTEPTPLPRNALLATDGQGTVYAAFQVGPSINVGQVVAGNVVTSGSWPGYLQAFDVDRRGNKVVVYQSESLWSYVRRFDVDVGWGPEVLFELDTDIPFTVDESHGGYEIAMADDSGDAMVAWLKKRMGIGNNTTLVRYEIKAMRYDGASRSWESPPFSVVIENPDWEHYFTDYNTFTPIISLAMNGRGDAIIAWAGWVDPPWPVVRARAYRSEPRGWQEITTVISSTLVEPNQIDVAIDWRGNSFVTSHHSGEVILAARYDVAAGWGAQEIVARLGSYWHEAAGWLMRPSFRDSLLAVDACGSALLVFEKAEQGYTSLWSKQYVPDTGWQDSAVLIEPVFNVGVGQNPYGGPITKRSKVALSLAMHGGKGATLISGERSGAPDQNGVGLGVRLFSRQHKAGVGWSSLVSSIDGGEPCRAPVIDAFGNAVSASFAKQPDDNEMSCYGGAASGLERLE
jgi:hypothetical protein